MSGRGRGRGRGSGRGRRSGRGRGRSRGQSGGRSRGGFRAPRGRGGHGKDANDETAVEKKELSIEDDPKAFFTGTASTAQHLEAQNGNRIRYVATLAILLKNKIEITQNARIRSLAMAWARGDQELASVFLSLRSQYGLVEVLRAVSMLDAGRQARAVEKHLKYLQLSGKKVRPQKLGKMKSDIDNLNKQKPPIGSASGAVCKHIANWVRGFTAKELEFFAINFPKDPWKKLADICHFNPEKDFPTAPWFLPYCFGTGSPPADSLIAHCQNLTQDTVNDLVKQHDIPYMVVNQFKENLTVESKQRIAQYEQKLDTVLWWYEVLSCPEVDEIISQRLTSGESVNLPNGKLLERLLTIATGGKPPRTRQILNYEEVTASFFKQLVEVAEPRLTSIKLDLESPVVVIGDASGSMEVAIRTSTIIASLLTAICSAKLVFFNDKTRDAPFQPKTVNEMLKLALTTVAEGSTAPAASLYPFYENKEKIKTIIVVTDEEENAEAHGYRFAPLFKKYHDEVYPARLVFVSFLHGQHETGEMVTELNNIGFHPKFLRLDRSRPDLTKLDDLFAQLSTTATTLFHEELLETEELVKKNGVDKLFEPLTKCEE